MKIALKSRRYFLLFTLAVLLIGPGCRSDSNAAGPEKQEARAGKQETAGVALSEGALRATPIKTETLRKRRITLSVKAPGVVAFNEKKFMCLSARTAGRIEELSAFSGDRVKAGAILMSLHSPEILAAQEEYLRLASRLDRALKDKDAEGIRLSEQMLEAAVQKLKIMGMADERIRAVKESGKADLLLAVSAPFDGSVIESRVVKGDAVAAGAELLKLADLRTIWILANINEKDLALVAVGQKADVSFDAYPGEPFSGTLILLYDKLDEETRTVKGRIELPNPGLRLKPGMYARATFEAPAEREVLAVPETAVRRMEGKVVVFIPAEAGRFEIREVKTGRAFPGFVEILEGVAEGERVVTEGSFTLKSEMLKKSFGGEEK